MARTTPPAGSRKGRAGLRRSLLVALLAACAVIGALIAPAGVRASTAAQLQRLARLDAAQVEAVVRADPAQLLELANANPEETAREWPRLPKGDRAQLERLLPGFVGNFDGVPYATRDRANKRLLQQRLSWECPPLSQTEGCIRLSRSVGSLTRNAGKSCTRRAARCTG